MNGIPAISSGSGMRLRRPPVNPAGHSIGSIFPGFPYRGRRTPGNENMSASHMPSLTMYRNPQYLTADLEALNGDFEYACNPHLCLHSIRIMS